MGNRKHTDASKENTRHLYHQGDRVSIHETEWNSVHHQEEEKEI